MRVHLVDASPYVFRAFFAIPGSLVDADGEPANAVYGFGDFLLRLVEEESPTHLAVAFDGSLTTSFRNDSYPAYKAHREPPPEDLERQLPACRELAEALGAATFSDPRYEADDLIATLCARSGAAVVVSGDKDLAQLVTDRVELYDFAKGARYAPRDVEAKFGVRPDQIADLLALAGDAVDNIPGVRGIGPKTAVALLRAFGTLERVYERLDDVAALPLRGAASVRARLAEQRDAAFLSKRLAEVRRDAPVEAGEEALAYRGADRDKAERFFARFDFGSLRGRIRGWR
jgi:5'-3' exonuclease